MALEVGIVGLPNAGKSTLFNALAARRLAATAPRPFTTIDPHEAIVDVPDHYLDSLTKLVNPKDSVSATVNIVDIAGLVKDAHKGEGLGNEFLGKIREVDAIVHVVRGFLDPSVTHQHLRYEIGSTEQIFDDIEIVNLELLLGGIEKKPTVYVLNVDEQQLKDKNELKNLVIAVTKKFKDPAITVSAQLEEELVDLSRYERKEYLKETGIDKSSLEQLIAWSYELLGLITFYTIKGGKEVHAWSLKKGSTAIKAAETVHTDFAKNFIKAEVIGVEELLKIGALVSSKHSEDAWKEAKDKGKIRLEGKDYMVQDKDVIEFKVSA